MFPSYPRLPERHVFHAENYTTDVLRVVKPIAHYRVASSSSIAHLTQTGYMCEANIAGPR